MEVNALCVVVPVTFEEPASLDAGEDTVIGEASGSVPVTRRDEGEAREWPCLVRATDGNSKKDGKKVKLSTLVRSLPSFLMGRSRTIADAVRGIRSNRWITSRSRLCMAHSSKLPSPLSSRRSQSQKPPRQYFQEESRGKE